MPFSGVELLSAQRLADPLVALSNPDSDVPAWNENQNMGIAAMQTKSPD